MGIVPACCAMGPPLGQAGEAPIMPSHALSNPASRQVTHAMNNSLLPESVQIQ